MPSGNPRALKKHAQVNRASAHPPSTTPSKPSDLRTLRGTRHTVHHPPAPPAHTKQTHRPASHWIAEPRNSSGMPQKVPHPPTHPPRPPTPSRSPNPRRALAHLRRPPSHPTALQGEAIPSTDQAYDHQSRPTTSASRVKSLVRQEPQHLATSDESRQPHRPQEHTPDGRSPSQPRAQPQQGIRRQRKQRSMQTGTNGSATSCRHLTQHPARTRQYREAPPPSASPAKGTRPNPQSNRTATTNPR